MVAPALQRRLQGVVVGIGPVGHLVYLAQVREDRAVLSGFSLVLGLQSYVEAVMLRRQR